MEHRIHLTTEEAYDLSQKLEFLETSYVRDEYTGTKRIRQDSKGTEDKEYRTPVKGIVHRFSSLCRMGNIENIWFEIKWTNKTSRFEIEFEDEVPKEYTSRPNLKGWSILEE